MRTLYSSRLCARYGVGPNTSATLFTVPEGQRASIKAIQVRPYSNAAGAVLLKIMPSGANVIRVTWADNSVAQIFNTTIVVHELESFAAVFQTSDCYVVASGFLFQGSGGPLALDVANSADREPSPELWGPAASS